MRTKVICYVDDPTPVAFIDLYEPGDKWVKVQGCDKCALETRLHCCGNHQITSCPMQDKLTGNCRWNLPPNNDKPWSCVIKPIPSRCVNFSNNQSCCLEYECVQGMYKGKIRRLRDRQGVFVDG